ncbi:MAG: DUF11 domain-containing protein [Thermoanaerobaculia bacterium]|nr:DUF11 domain-containing protein [Thermoanaerobaculia bacterium]
MSDHPTFRHSGSGRPWLAVGLLAFAATAASSQVAVPIGDLPPGASITVEVLVTVNGTVPAGVEEIANQGSVTGANLPPTPTDDPATAAPGDPTLTPLVAAPDLTLAKGDGGASVAPGGTVAYTLSVSNVGNQGATGVALSETVPAHAIFNAGASTAGWSCADGSPAGTACTLAVGSLAAGASGNATFAVTVVDPVAAGVTQIANTASVADDGANGADPTPADNSASDTTPVDAQPDLSLTKSDGGASVAPGGTVAYALTYSNAGNQDATGVVLTETVPANSAFDAGASTAGWACAPNGNAGSTCTLAIGALAGGGGGGSATFAVAVVNPVAAGVTQIANTASVGDDGTNGADPTPADNSASDTTPVDAAPDLAIVKDYSGPTPAPGDVFTFALSYSNVGNQGATGVALTETVPANTTFDAAGSSAGWSCADNSPAGTSCSLAIGAVAGGGAGGTRDFAVQLDDPLPGGVDSVSNTVSIADDGANGVDPDPANNSSTEVVSLDIVPPQVALLDSIPSTADSELTACEQVTFPLHQLIVVFDEPVRDPAGDSDPDDVTNPANYRVVLPGANLAFETESCAGPTGDDTTMAVTAVTYQAASSTATLDLAGPLAGTQVRLLVCGSTSIRDLAGNPLDGDGDGTGGDDFGRLFRVDNGNLFVNGHFDCDLGSWTTTASAGAVVAHAADDADLSPQSGSARATVATATATAEQAALGQCVPIVPGERYDLSGRVRIDAPPFVFVGVTRACEFFGAPQCAGAPIGNAGQGGAVADTAGAWATFAQSFSAPGNAASAICGFSLETASGTPFDANLDRLRLVRFSALFDDGFESGSLSAWSQSFGN